MRAIDADKLVWRKTCHGIDCLYPEDIENAETILKWTLVKDENPIEPEAYYVSWYSDKQRRSFVGICEWNGDYWVVEDMEQSKYADVNIIAWMELLDPYEE